MTAVWGGQLDMSDYEIRAALRGATAAGVLTGWQGPHTAERSYTIAPVNGGASEQSLDDVVRYCVGLRAAGIESVYRASEPIA